MKKSIISLVMLVAVTVSLFAQVPQAISYQAVARNMSGMVLINTEVNMQISILVGSSTGNSVYVERHNVTTNEFGLITLKIGMGIIQKGNFSQIDWSANAHFAKIEIDITNGTNFIEVGTSEILSVPYALMSKTAETAKTADYNSLINLPNLFSGNFTDLQNKPSTLSGYGITDYFNGSYTSLSNLPSLFTGSYNDLKDKPLEIIPRIATQGQYLSVSFSGGDALNFSQASNTCPSVWANAELRFSQGSSTIQPIDIYYINNKRFDIIFDIPFDIPSGFYDIILGPGTSCEEVIGSSFKIY